jgi:hypothetical protein
MKDRNPINFKRKFKVNVYHIVVCVRLHIQLVKDIYYIHLTELNAKHAELYFIAQTKIIKQPKNKLKWWRETVVQFKDALERKWIIYFYFRQIILLC